MEELMKFLIFFCLVFWGKVFAAPLQAHQSGGEEHIVIIDNSHPTPPEVAEVLDRLALNTSHPDVRHIYNNSAFRGFAASMKSHCLDLLANMTDIHMVEKAVEVTRMYNPSPLNGRNHPSYQSRPNSPWGLQRISTSSPSISGSPKSMDYTYNYATSDLGRNADIYIIDTGIYTAHSVFGGRARMAWSFDSNDLTDSDGHGTHVAGTAAGAILGVASNANLHGVKALGAKGGGISSSVVAAIDYVITSHEQRKGSASPQSPFVGSVISMSLASTGVVSAIDLALRSASKAGVHAVVAAGNAGVDACSSSPSAAGGDGGPAITVGSTSMAGEVSVFSNTGSCVDVYAPGENVISSWIGGPQMIQSLSGTSMATPHVTGIVACAMGNATLAADPGLMKEWVRMMALRSDSGDGVLLANNGVRADLGQGVVGLQRLSVSKSRFTDAGEVVSNTKKRGLVGRTLSRLGARGQ